MSEVANEIQILLSIIKSHLMSCIKLASPKASTSDLLLKGGISRLEISSSSVQDSWTSTTPLHLIFEPLLLSDLTQSARQMVNAGPGSAKKRK